MNGSELYQYILNHTEHTLQGTWETTEQNQLKVTGTNVNGSYVVFSELGALNNFILEWEMTILSSGGYINSGISPILLTDPTGSSAEGWNNGTITNAKFVYFMCNYTGGGNVGTLSSIRDNGSMSRVNSSTGSFTVGTKYTYKLVRADGYLRLYQDNNLISEYQETTYADTPFYLGWYMWYGGTYSGYQANFIIDNYVITDLSTNTINYVNKPGVAEIWANIKNYITAQLLGKADSIHTHTKNQITDFPSLSTVATSGSYNDLTNKPTIPTVNNATLTIQKNGTNVATFTSNSNTDVTANISVPTKTSDLTNDSGFLTSHQDLSGYMPRSGGAVMTDYFLGRSADTGSFMLNGGTAWDKGGSIELFGANNNDSYHQGSVRIQPAKNNTTYKKMELLPNGTWTWTGSACAVSSDSRLKDEIKSIPDEILDAWENLEPKQYKLKSELETDKENAQVHYGWIAQDVESVIKGNRKGSVKNGLWLHEEWGEQKEVSHEETYTEEVETKSGKKQTVTKTQKVIDQPYRAKGDSYGLRYTECLVVECKYLRRCIARLTARIEELEKGNNTK